MASGIMNNIQTVILAKRGVPTVTGIPLQAIDLIDEAGSRARIQAFMARQGTGGNAAVQRQPWEELAQVMEAKAIAIQVSRGIPGSVTYIWLRKGSVHSAEVKTL